MSHVKCKNKQTGITYVYESESYWDKEKQQPRARRRLIGKIDDETGEIIPTNKRGRKRKNVPNSDTKTTVELSYYENQLKEKDCQIKQLTAENQKLTKEKEKLINDLYHILAGYKVPTT